MDANTLNLIGRAQHGIPADAAATLLAELDAMTAKPICAHRPSSMTDICRRYRLCADL